MRRITRTRKFLAVPLRATLLGWLLAAAVVAEPPRLTLERLYSQPSLIGTAPSGVAWSPDSRRVAFLWNDAGETFLDVWLIDAIDAGAVPERLTRLPQIEVPASGDAFEIARARERRERDGGVGSVTWHPRGDWLLATFRGDLWRIAPGSEPLPLTRTESTESRAAFSPDGGAITFVRDNDLWSLPERGGTPQRITDFPAGTTVRLASYRWAPGGRYLAVLESDRSAVPERSIPDYRPGDPDSEPVLRRLRRAYPGEPAPAERLGLVPATGGAIEWLTVADPAPEMILGYAWSPDGRRLAVDTSDLYAKDRRIFVVDVADGARTARLLVREADPENETFYFWRIAWSTDSRRLYFLSDRDEDYHVWAIDPATVDSGSERLTSGPWAVASLHPVDDGVVVVGNRGNAEERQIFRVPDGGGEPVRLSEKPGTHSPTVSPDGRLAAVHFSSDATPPDMLLTALRGERSERQVTRSPSPEFADYRWVTPTYVRFPSHVDGTTLHGRLTLPPDFDPQRKWPAILGSVYTDSVRNQWGGRTAHPTWGLDQYLAQEGYVLLNVDMRGSWGRGKAHRRGIRLDYGGMDIEDLESGVRFLGTLGYVDMERVGIWGSSYGGLMTTMSLFRKPGLYAAGIAGAPATNVWHALTGQMAVMMRPEDQPDAYADSSPFLHAEGLEDPLMIIHGMRDWIVLYKDSLHLVERLLLLDKDVDLVTLPEAGHGWDAEGLAQTRFAFRKMVDFFDRQVKNRAD